MTNKDVLVHVTVDYQGTVVHKTVRVPNTGETNAVMVNRGLEFVTKKIQIMVQSEQQLTSPNAESDVK